MEKLSAPLTDEVVHKHTALASLRRRDHGICTLLAALPGDHEQKTDSLALFLLQFDFPYAIITRYSF